MRTSSYLACLFALLFGLACLLVGAAADEAQQWHHASDEWQKAAEAWEQSASYWRGYAETCRDLHAGEDVGPKYEEWATRTLPVLDQDVTRFGSTVSGDSAVNAFPQGFIVAGSQGDDGLLRPLTSDNRGYVYAVCK